MKYLTKIDPYQILNISMNAEEKDIRKAYKKQALCCHPDKNPNNPKAAEVFQQLSKALEILTDVTARAAYDKVLKARNAAQVHNRELDCRTRKFKEDLEAREKLAREETEAKKQQRENERLRAEAYRKLEEENECLRLKNKRERQQIEKRKLDLSKGETNGMPRLKKQMFECMKGLHEIPATLLWMSSQPKVPQNSPLNNFRSHQPARELWDDPKLTLEDYETLVFMRMQQAEEQKRLNQKMKDEDK